MAMNSKPEVHMLGAVLAFELAQSMVTTGIWMLNPASMMGKVASLSSYPHIFAYLWMSLALWVVPYFVLKLTGFGQKCQRLITRLACWAILTSGVFWIYLAYISKGMDYSGLTGVFIFHGLTCVATSSLLAYTLNNTRVQRELCKDTTT